MCYKQQSRQNKINTQFRVLFKSVNATLLARKMQFTLVHNEQNYVLVVILGGTLQEKKTSDPIIYITINI